MSRLPRALGVVDVDLVAGRRLGNRNGDADRAGDRPGPRDEVPASDGAVDLPAVCVEKANDGGRVPEPNRAADLKVRAPRCHRLFAEVRPLAKSGPGNAEAGNDSRGGLHARSRRIEWASGLDAHQVAARGGDHVREYESERPADPVRDGADLSLCGHAVSSSGNLPSIPRDSLPVRALNLAILLAWLAGTALVCGGCSPDLGRTKEQKRQDGLRSSVKELHADGVKAWEAHRELKREVSDLRNELEARGLIGPAANITKEKP